jgi:long-subunit fatty acid transport protein
MGDIHSNLALGYSVNFYSVGFGESVTGEDLGSDWTVGFDAGVVAEVRTRTKIGAFVRNFNHPMLGEEYGRDLPRALTVGLSYIPYSGVSTNIDVEKAVDSDAVIHGGMEYAVTENVTIRAGLVNNPVSFSAGFKAHLSGISIEYSYVDHPVMPGSHYIGIGYAK